jgi:hypothetical protein
MTLAAQNEKIIRIKTRSFYENRSAHCHEILLPNGEINLISRQNFVEYSIQLPQHKAQHLCPQDD